MVIDEYDIGYPISFCISNKITEEALCVFLDAIKTVAGISTCNVFMSDDAPSYLNAWRKVDHFITIHLTTIYNIFMEFVILFNMIR